MTPLMTPLFPQMAQSVRLLCTALLVLVGTGCATQRTTKTGFLQPLGYHSFLVDEVTFVAGDAGAPTPNSRSLEDLKVVYRAALEKAFTARLKPVNQAGPGVLRVRAAITGYEGANVWLNLAASTVIGPVTAGGASTEAEVVDSITGARVASLATHSNGTPFLGGPFNYYKRHGHARTAVRRHAEKLGKRLEPVAGDVQ